MLRSNGTVWLNPGDSYVSADGSNNEADHFQNKDLMLIPHRVEIALQDAGWWVRNNNFWIKDNCMPESVRSRCTRNHEYVFQLAKSEQYYFNAEAIKEPAKWERWGNQTIKKDYRGIRPIDMKTLDDRRKAGRNKRSTWHINTVPYPEFHTAVFPPELPRLCILAGCPEGGRVLDLFVGSGTTAYVAAELGRKCIGIDLSLDYLKLAEKRCQQLTIFGALLETEE